MKTKLKTELIRDEGVRLKPYMCPAGKLTIGVGRNLDDVGLSEEEALHLLDNDIEGTCVGLDRALPWWRDLDEVRRRALANMCFNLGLSRLLKFRKMLSALEAGDFNRAAFEAQDSRWFKQTKTRAVRICEMIRKGNDYDR